MFDGSAIDFDENIRITKKIVEFSHFFNVSVEASLGKMPYSFEGTTGLIKINEDEIIKVDDLSRNINLTNIDEAIEFVSKTGIDILAPSIGNVHALYLDSIPEPNWVLGKKIHEAVKVPLALHGSTGATDIQIKKAISIGFRKINVATKFYEIYRKTMIKTVEKYKGYASAFLILNDCKLSMKKEIERLIKEVYHSDNKA